MWHVVTLQRSAKDRGPRERGRRLLMTQLRGSIMAFVVGEELKGEWAHDRAEAGGYKEIILDIDCV